MSPEMNQPIFHKNELFFWQALPVLTSVLISQRLGEFWPQDVREQVETEIARFQGKVTTPAGAVTLGWSSRITGKMVNVWDNPQPWLIAIL